MLCKLSSKNQITLPKDLLETLEDQLWFDAKREGGRIILEPVVVRPLETPSLASIRERIRERGINEEDVAILVDESRHACHS